MVEYQTRRQTPQQASADSRLDAIFHALGDATRRHMLRGLAAGEQTVSQLAEPFDMSLAAASKHIKALESAGLIEREIQGRTHVCSLSAEPLASAYEWLRQYEQFWNLRLDALEQLLREDDRRKSSISAVKKPTRKGKRK
jgi:DNA-binding transcriptional ArsR family regulator